MPIVHVIQENVRGCHSVAFDEHAIRRMQDRSVSEDEVLEVLRNPDRTDLPTLPGRLRFRKNQGSSAWIDVILEQDPMQIVIIPVWRRQAP